MILTARAAIRCIRVVAWAAWCMAQASHASAADAVPQVAITPAGDVGVVHQVVARFSEPMWDASRGGTAFDDAVTLGCSNRSVSADGHWSDPKTFVIDIDGVLPPRSTCAVTVGAGLRSLAGVALPVPAPVMLHALGPGIQQVMPVPGDRVTIVERQSFALLMSGPMPQAEILARTHCEVAAAGATQRLGVVPVPDAERGVLAKALGFEPHPDRVAVVACERPLPPGARVSVVFAPDSHDAIEPQRIDYTVRSGFTVRFEPDCGAPWQRTGRRGGLRCDAEARRIDSFANVNIVFSRPVSVESAMRVRLQTAGGERAPTPANLQVIDPWMPDPRVTRVVFTGPFQPGDRLVANVPAELADDEGMRRADAATPLAPITVVAGLGDVEAVSLSTGAFAVRGLADGAEVVVDSAAAVRLRGARVLRVPSELAVAGGFDDAALMRWLDVAQRYRSGGLARRDDLATDLGADVAARAPAVSIASDGAVAQHFVATSALSLLDDQPAAIERSLSPRPPATSDRRLASLHLDGPGLQLVEAAYDAPENDEVVGVAHERSLVLVTDLALHLFSGSNGVLAWVTSRSTGQPVRGARVQMSDCSGRRVADGTTDDRGTAWMPDRAGEAGTSACPGAAREHALADRFVTARLPSAGGRQDLAFVWTSWGTGEGAFASDAARLDGAVQTLAGRRLLAPGQTVAMKHWLRRRTLDGWEVPPRSTWPTQVVVTDPSGDETTLPLQWSDRGDAHWQWPVPASARRGTYDVALVADGRRVRAAQFEVRDFRIPEIDASLAALDAPWRAGAPLTIEVTARYFNGGAAVGTPVVLESQLETWPADGPGGASAPAPKDMWTYAWDRGPILFQDEDRWEFYGDTFASPLETGAFADRPRQLQTNPRQTALIDAGGHARFSLPGVTNGTIGNLEASLRFADPDGEVRRLPLQQVVWPSTRRIGLRVDPDRTPGQTTLAVAVADLHGQPVAGAVVKLEAALTELSRERVSFRDGFDVVHVRSASHEFALAPECRLVTDASGLARCTVVTPRGSLRVQASVADASGALARTSAVSDWSPQRPAYGQAGFAMPPSHSDAGTAARKWLPAPLEVYVHDGAHRVGDTVTADVLGHFDHQAAMLLVETEGVLDWRGIVLDGDDPTFSWTIGRRWMPNASLKVVALAPATQDLGQGEVAGHAAPVLRSGRTDVTLDPSNVRLDVGVKSDATRLRPGEATRIRVHVARADGSAVPPGAHVALAVVDDALSKLLPNDLHELEQALRSRRAAGVAVASLQYRPAPPAGRPWIVTGAPMARAAGDTTVQRVEVTGSAVRRPETSAKLRSVFDTSLAWLPDVALDASGDATVSVTANDSLAHWRVIVVADGWTADDGLVAGSGEAFFDTRQPLQLSAGLPPVVRTGDAYRAVVSVRNDTDDAVDTRVSARVGNTELGVRPAHLPPHGRVDVDWQARAPDAAGELVWEFGAGDGASGDRLEFRQRVIAGVPQTVREATLLQVRGATDVPLLPVAGANASLSLHAMPSLGADLPGVAAFFRDYRYRCLEQRVSLAVGQRDAKAWQGIADDLASYLDVDDLPSWFPPPGDAQELLRTGPGDSGSDVLASYIVAIAAEARSQGLPFAFAEASGRHVVAALTRVALGIVRRDEGALAVGTTSAGTLRRLAATAALARIGAAQPSMLEGLPFDAAWPTSALLDLRQIVDGMPALPDRDATRARVDAALRARLDERGSRVSLVARAGDERADAMAHPDVDAVRLALLAIRDPAWQDLAPRLVAGALARQQHGHWATTVANAWGTLMMAEFARRSEAQAVTGTLVASVDAGAARPVVDWGAAPGGGSSTIARASGAAATLHLAQRGTGAPWVSVLASAAVPVTRPHNHGFAIRKTLTPVTPRPGGALERGDLVRVHLEVESSADTSWVVVDDPLPAGASVASGVPFGRDPELAGWQRRRREPNQLAWVEQRFDRYEAFFSHVSAGRLAIDYVMRLDTAGRLVLPATRVEAMYAPEMFGEWPNAAIVVAPR